MYALRYKIYVIELQEETNFDRIRVLLEFSLHFEEFVTFEI